MIDFSEETLKYIILGLLIIILILLLLLIICCCCFCRKSRKYKSREIKINEKNIIRQISKTYNENDSNNNSNINGFKSYNSEKPMLEASINSYSMKRNCSEYIDVPPSIYNTNSLNRSIADSRYGSLGRGLLLPSDANNRTSMALDIGNSTLQRTSYYSAETTDSQYMPSLKTIMNYSFTEGHRYRNNKTPERKQSLLSAHSSRIDTPSIGSSSVIASSIPGNYASLGRNNMKSVVPMIHDDNSYSTLHENSFQSSRSSMNYNNVPQLLISQESPQLQNPDTSIMTYPKPVKYKDYGLDVLSNKSYGNIYQQNLDINLSNLRIGPTFTIKDLEEMGQEYDVNDVDAIVDDAENILDALSHHSFSSSNNQTASLLGNSSSKDNLTLSPKNSLLSVGSNVAIKSINTINTMDYDDIIAGGMNNDTISQNDHNKINNFQKAIPSSHIQHTVETNHSQKILVGETIQNNHENSIILSEVTISNNNNNNNDNNNQIHSNNSTHYDSLKPEEILDKKASTDDLSNVKIHKIDDPSNIFSSTSLNRNLNSNFLNYKKEQIMSSHDKSFVTNNNNNGNGNGIDNSNHNHNNEIIMNKSINDHKNSTVISLSQDSVENDHMEIKKKNKVYNVISPISSSLSINTDDLNIHEINLNVDHELSPRSSSLKTPDHNKSFTSIKSGSNFFVKSPISPIANNHDYNTYNGRLYNPNYDSSNKENIDIARMNSYDDSMANRSFRHPQDKTFPRVTSYDDSVNNRSFRQYQDKTYPRITSYDDFNLRHLNNGTINRSMDRSYMLNSSHIVRNHSQMSLSTINNSLNRNIYNPSLSRSYMSSLNRYEDSNASIITDAPSIVSVENIVPPSVRHSQRIDNLKKEEPTVHKVKVNYSIDDIPDDVEIKDEIEEDIFMRPSMVRYVEIEQGPVLQQAETTRISYISSQSSEVPQILDQELLDSLRDNNENEKEDDVDDNSTEKGENSSEKVEESKEKIEESNEKVEESNEKIEESNEKVEESNENNEAKEILKLPSKVHSNVKEEDEEITAKNEKLESPLTTVIITGSPSPSSLNHDIIIKPEDTEVINTDSERVELIKNKNTSVSEDDDISSSTLNESTITSEIIRLENNQTNPKPEKEIENL